MICKYCKGEIKDGQDYVDGVNGPIHYYETCCLDGFKARAEAAEAERDALRAQLDELTERYTECVGLLANNNLLYHLTGYRSPLLDAKEG